MDYYIIEIQFQLKTLFDILGNDGYKIHREAINIQKLFCKQSETKSEKVYDKLLDLPHNPIMLCRCVENDGKNDSRNLVHELVVGFCNMRNILACYPSDKMDKDINNITEQYKERDETAKNSPGVLQRKSKLFSHLRFFNNNRDTTQEEEASKDAKQSPMALLNISHFVSQLRLEITAFSPADLSSLLASTACVDIAENSHDLSLYLCLYQVYVKRYSLTGDIFDRDKAEKAVSACLELIDHSNAVGMVGWLTSCNGKSHVLDRTLERPYEALSDLAAFHASNGDWDAALEVLRSLVLRAENRLPLYHPIVISSLLDLAASFSNLGQSSHAIKFTQRATKRLQGYLGEQEQACSMIHRMQSKPPMGDPDPIGYYKHMGLDHLAMLKAFVGYMRYLRRRTMTTVLGKNHPMILLFDCFLGDSLSVLGICLDIESRRIIGKESNLIDEKSNVECKLVWMVAGEFYRTSLKGWTEIHGLLHPNIPSTACGLARCLREIDRRKEALKVLSSVVSSYQKDKCHQRKTLELSMPVPLIPHPPPLSSDRRTMLDVQARYCQSIAICLWSMAVYTIEETPNERGRMRALTLLHTAMEEIQSEIESYLEPCEKSDEDRLKELFNILEDEAKSLSSTQKRTCDNKQSDSKSTKHTGSKQDKPRNFGSGQRQAVVSV